MVQRKPKIAQASTQKAEKKRAEILNAAAKCFRKTGFHLASMQEICTETGLGPGAVYRYFSSKDTIIEAMAEEERSQARIVLTSLESQEFPDAITEITEALAERYLAIHDTGLMVEIYAEGLRNKRVGSAVKKIESEWIERLTELLRSAQVKNQIDPSLDPHHTALFLTAVWDGMIVRHAYHSADIRQAFTEFCRTMLNRMLAKDGKTEKRKTSPSVTALPVIAPIENEPSGEIDTRQLSLI